MTVNLIFLFSFSSLAGRSVS